MFSFPNPVNEVAARVVAGGVVVLCVAAMALRQPWLLVPLAYGFWARVLTGPTLSPLGQLATRVIAPRLPAAPRPVAGPPKRFAQAMGVVFSTTAVVLWFGFGAHTAPPGSWSACSPWRPCSSRPSACASAAGSSACSCASGSSPRGVRGVRRHHGAPPRAARRARRPAARVAVVADERRLRPGAARARR